MLTVHLVGVVLWMGGLLMLSRIMGYHAREAPSVRPRYTWLEGRLNYLVTVPGAVLAIGAGVAQAYLHGAAWFRVARWMHIKLTLVFAIVVIHVILTVLHRRNVRRPPDAPMKRAVFAALHGTLGLILIAVVYLAFAQPMR